MRDDCLHNLFSECHTHTQMALLENWSGVMYDMMTAVEVDQQPIRDANPYIGLLYVLFMIIGSLSIINLVIGVSINKVGVC